uniref:Uncharacterized protein n=1 Tax=Anser brachyrhynchus TaxID=132585 RepID=A0A8B9CT71_9AVES
GSSRSRLAVTHAVHFSRDSFCLVSILACLWVRSVLHISGFWLNAKRGSQKAKQEETKKKKGIIRRPLMSKPVDDVYLTWLYKRPSYNVEEAVGMLKKFQELDFTYPKQYVYINVFLDTALQKKVSSKRIRRCSDFFCNMGRLSFKCRVDVSVGLLSCFFQLLCLAVRVQSAFAGGFMPLLCILEDEIQVDSYVAVPAIMPKLIPLRGKLRRKYPSTKRNSLGHDIPKMLQLFREGLEYTVEDERVIKTRIARVSMESS